MNKYYQLLISLFFGFLFLIIDKFEYKFKNYLKFINLTPFIHALITSIPSFYSYINNKNIIEYLSTTPPENIHVFYKIIPCITLGYGILDTYEGIRSKRKDFILHGLIILISFSFVLYNDGIHICFLPIINEVSSIFLNIAKNNYTKLLFFIVFTYIRFYIFPIICYNYVYITPYNYYNYYTAILFSAIGMILNIYWYYKMIKIILNYNKHQIKQN